MTIIDVPFKLSHKKNNLQDTLRSAEDVPLAISHAMNKAKVVKYFELLEKVLSDNDLFSKANRIFKMDETRMQLNKRQG